MTAKFDPALLDVLVCPEDKSSLALAPEELLKQLNRLVEAKTLRNREGALLQNRLQAGLVRKDGRILYPIVDGVPQLVREDAIAIDR